MIYRSLIFLIFLVITGTLLKGQDNGDSLFLVPGIYIDSSNPKILEKDSVLISGCRTTEEKLRNIFEYVRDSYTDSVFDSFKASDILEMGGNSCRQRSILLAALCRAAGIPARLQWQMVILKNYKYGNDSTADYVFVHGVTGINIDGKWYVYDAVGNAAKWKVWVQRDEKRIIPFKFKQHCVFDETEKVKIQTLPIFFTDYDEVFPQLYEKVENNKIGFSKTIL